MLTNSTVKSKHGLSWMEEGEDDDDDDDDDDDEEEEEEEEEKDVLSLPIF